MGRPVDTSLKQHLGGKYNALLATNTVRGWYYTRIVCISHALP